MGKEAKSKKDLIQIIVELEALLENKEKAYQELLASITSSGLDIESLKDSSARNKALLSAIPDLMFIFDSEARFVDFHAEKPGDLYASPEFFLGKRPEDVLPSNVGIMTEERVNKILKTGQPDISTYELEIGGELRHFESRGVLYGSDHVLAIVRDISDLKRVSELQKASEERYKSVLNASPDNICITDAEGKILLVSPAGLTMFGYDSTSELAGMMVTDFIIPSDRDRAVKNISLMYQGIMSGPASYCGIRKDGSIIYVEANAELVRGPGGKTEQMVFIIRDITVRKKTEDALTESLKKYRHDFMFLNSILDSPVNVIVFALDKNYCYTTFTKFHSETMQKIWGVDIQMGMNMLDIISDPTDRQKAKANFDRALNGEYFVLTEEYGDTKLHRTFYEDYYSCIKDSENNIVGVSVFVIDITERKKAERELYESEEKYRLIAENTSDGIMFFGGDNIIQYVSPSYRRQLGYSETDDIKRTPEEVYATIHPDERDEIFQRIFKAIESKQSELIYTYRVKHKAGHYFWREDRTKFKYDARGNYAGAYVISRDITEWKAMVARLEEAKEKAEAGNRLKTSFMNNISHELRTPLNGILGFSSLIIQPDISEEEKAKFHSEIRSSSRRLLRTITNYMDSSLLATGNFDVRPKSLDLHRLLQQVRTRFQHQFSEKNLDLHLELPSGQETLLLYSDPELIQLIFTQLLENALIYTIEGSVKFGYEKLPGMLNFYVSDTGPGIAPEFQSSIFEIFVQPEKSAASGQEGSGLGLSIARGLVSLLGGDISVKSELRKGSTFYFTIPHKIAEEPDVITAEAFRDLPLTESPVILIVENDPTNALLVQTMLRHCGAKILLARNGREAVTTCKDHSEITLVLMDMKMPVMDGFEATRQIRSFRQTLPIIAMTAFALSGDEKNAIECGCSDYLAKPFGNDVFLNKLKRYGIKC